MTAAGLTNREQQVLAALAEGKSNKQIGIDLDLTESTIKAYVHAIFVKLGVANRTSATLAFIRGQLPDVSHPETWD
jgi:DNA-binding NarL/FixJ family response regulator